MDVTHFTSTREEPTTHTRNPTAGGRRILAFSSRANAVISRQLESRSSRSEQHQILQAQNLEVHDSLLVPKQHNVNDANDKAQSQAKDHSGRERMKRHREEVAGRVLIPDKWSQENLLKDWMDYASFDQLLAPSGIESARQALVAEGRRTSSQRLRIESRC